MKINLKKVIILGVLVIAATFVSSTQTFAASSSNTLSTISSSDWKALLTGAGTNVSKYAIKSGTTAIPKGFKLQSGSGTYNINGLSVTVNLYCNDNCNGHRSYIQKDAAAFAQAQFVGVGTLEPKPDCSNSFYLITVNCPAGQVINSTKTKCVDAGTITTTTTTNTGGGCPSGQSLDPTTNKCVGGNSACANGAIDAGTCTNCPTGEKLNGSNICVCSNGATDPGLCKSCPSGKCLVGGTCSSSGTNYCQAGNIVNSCGLVTQCVGSTACQMVGGVATCVSNASGQQDMVTLTASPSHVQSGGRCTLNWTVQGATSCTLNGVGINNQSISLTSGTGSIQGGVLDSSATYTMVCSNGTQTVTKTATCSVTPTLIEN